jgi:hypothetical protein
MVRRMEFDPEEVITLVDRICRSPVAKEDVLQLFADATLAGYNCFFQIGWELTSDGKPYLIHHFEGELVSFPISRAGARRLGMEALTLDSFRTPRRERSAVHHLMTLGAVRLSRVRRRESFSVTMEILDLRQKGETDVPLEFSFLMEAHSQGKQETGWIHVPTQLRKNMSLSFEMESEMLSDIKRRIPGPLTVFVSLCTPPQPLEPVDGKERVSFIQLSNLVGVVV